MSPWERLLHFSLSIGNLTLTLDRPCWSWQAAAIGVRRYKDWSICMLAIRELTGLIITEIRGNRNSYR
jgi:hypothetical protein